MKCPQQLCCYSLLLWFDVYVRFIFWVVVKTKWIVGMAVVNGSVHLMHHMLCEFLFRCCFCVSLGYVFYVLFVCSIRYQ
jgi:hypothetical protein